MLINWINYLQFSLEAMPVWPKKNQIGQSMPDSFKNSYANTRKKQAPEVFYQKSCS